MITAESGKRGLRERALQLVARSDRRREERHESGLEVVQIRRGESFKAWSHGYPFHTVRWHFHPEYEIHHVVATTGHYFVGDFIGEFEPGISC